MGETLSVRCSSLPRLVACAAAQVPPEVRVEPPRGPSDLGTAFHGCMARIVTDDALADDVEVAAGRYNVPADDLAPLVGWARRVWHERLSELFPSPVAEWSSSYTDALTLTLTGTNDLIALVPDEIRILDWKTGWADVDATEQLKGYAWLALNAYESFDQVRVTKLGVRRQAADTQVWTRAELAAWWGWLKVHLGVGRDTYRPGPHCGRCPRALECPGHLGQMQRLALDLYQQPETLELEPPQLLALQYQMIRLVANRCDQFLARVKAHVAAQGGTYGPLQLVEKERRSIDVARGMSLLDETLGSALLPLLTVSKTKVEDAVRANAPRGQKKSAVTELLDRLDAAGALVTTTHTQLEVQTNGDTAISRTHDDGDRTGH